MTTTAKPDGEERTSSPEPSPARTAGTTAISIRTGTGADTWRTREQDAPRRHPMRGFEDAYVDIVDWIVGITHRIWEDQDVGHIYDTYAPGVAVHDDHGTHYGVERVVEGTLQAIDAFPDTRSYADDVIWAGDEDRGFATSHRYVNVGHHLGAWRWGPATGRPLQLWGIANCVARDNAIFEEWVLYNTCSRLAAAGVDLRQAAREYGDELHGSGLDLHRTDVVRLVGGRAPQRFADTDEAQRPMPDVERWARALFHDLWNRRDLSVVDRAYSATALWHGTSDREARGAAEIKGRFRSLVATFPDLAMRVDEVYWMDDPDGRHRVSVRWSASATHRGWALYGRPTERRVSLWGIAQLYLDGGRVVEEWNLFNEFDLLAQILSETPR